MKHSNVNKCCVKTNLTERVKSPGLLLLGRARKLPWTPRVNKSCSASIPVTLGWNHLKRKTKQNSSPLQWSLESSTWVPARTPPPPPPRGGLVCVTFYNVRQSQLKILARRREDAQWISLMALAWAYAVGGSKISFADAMIINVPTCYSGGSPATFRPENALGVA